MSKDFLENLPTVFKRLDFDIFDYGLDRAAVDEETYRGLYMSNVAFLIGYAVSIGLSVLYQWVSLILVWLHLLSALISVALLGINITFQNRVLSGRLGCTYFFGFLVAVILLLGGINSPTVAWFMVLPLAAGLVVGWKDAAFWTGASVVALGAFYIIDTANVYQGPGVMAHREAFVNMILIGVLFVVVGVLLVTSLKRYAALEVALEQSIAKQIDEATTAKLLSDVASAANEESSFEMAGKACLGILCRSQAWQAGRLWLIREGQLVDLELWYFENPNEMQNKLMLVASNKQADELARRAMQTEFAVLVSDIPEQKEQWDNSFAHALGMRSHFAWPVFSAGEVVAVMEFFATELITYNERLEALISDISLQLSHVSEREQTRAQIENMAYVDGVTKLANRYAFERDMPAILREAKSAATSVALLFIDLDNFKRINDVLGHHAGDQLLRIIGQRLDGSVRGASALKTTAGSMVARLGGDEFIVVIQGIRDQREAELAATRILKVVSSPIEFSRVEYSIELSVGIALFPNDTTNIAELLLLADAAMYEAKQVRGSTFYFATDEINRRLTKQRSIAREIGPRNISERLSVHFEAVVRAEDFSVQAWELIPQWERGESTLTADEIMPIAEKIGLINAINDSIFERACLFAKRVNDESPGAGAIQVCIPVSTHQFSDNELAAKLQKILERHDCRSDWFCLVFKDLAGLSNDMMFNTVLRELGGLGVDFVLDGFDAGYRLLPYLKKHPFRRVKVNRALMPQLQDPEQGSSLVEAAVAMARTLDIKVTVTGVQSQVDADALRRSGCDFMQGDFFDALDRSYA